MIPLDVLFHNCRIVDVFRLRVFEGWVGIRDGRFVYVEEGALPQGIEAQERFDLHGKILMPGLIDSHMHIESSLITPRRFAEAVLPWGTTTILSDPHEVGNVAGASGVEWMIAASEETPLRIYHSIPSCVPATDPEIEWVGEVFTADTIRRLANSPSVIALGEVMDYQGLVGANERLREIVATAREMGLLLEGHIPTLSGMALSEYLTHGISSDHTLTFEAKINEQISKGLAVMLQTKSITPVNMAIVFALPDRSHILLVTDDIEPPLLQKGHLSRMVQLAANAGMPPLEAIAAATIRPARYLGLRDLGAIAPGFRADCLVMDDLTMFPPQSVYVDGMRIAEGGAMLDVSLPEQPPLPDYPAIPGGFTRNDFQIGEGYSGNVIANVIVLQNKKTTLTQLERIEVALRDGLPVFKTGDELALATVIARNRQSKFTGLILNTGIQRGAFASSVAHDCHNLIVIGRDVDAMTRAAEKVFEIGGGVVVDDGEAIQASLQLPYFGLMSGAPLAEVADDLSNVEDALRRLGVDHQRPFLTLSIMSLSVSPYIKFTDKGIVDTEERTLMGAYELLGI